MKQVPFLLLPLLALLFSCTAPGGQGGQSASSRPNILIIMADDMGYSDIGCYGSEISTPHLDELAAGGMRLTKFYNAARCCPSRASLLTGLYPHQASVGRMVEDLGHPSYRGFLGDQTVTIAEVLKEAGYSTMHIGKWHVGNEPPHWPGDRGFDQHFSFINGASSYYNLWPYRPGQDSLLMVHNGQRYRPGPGYYATDAFSDTAVAFIERQDPTRPFFMYLAHVAPHWPLHAFPEDIARYKGKYKIGWDSLRVERYQRMKALGILPADVPLSPRDQAVPAWDSLSEEEKDAWDTKMALYAAVIDRLDQGIGRIVEALHRKGQLENTLIVFLSDNGGCHEPMPGKNTPYPTDGSPGSERSFPSYDIPWANVSNTPYRLFKSWLNEGGMITPFIAHFPRQIPAGSINHATMGHIMDLMPTCVELAGAAYPQTYAGRAIMPTQGRSLLKGLQDVQAAGHDLLFWEHIHNKAVRQGDWKLIYNYRMPQRPGHKEWELYNLASDPAELNDVAAAHPEKVAELAQLYQQWATQNGVLEQPEIDSLHRAMPGQGVSK